MTVVLIRESRRCETQTQSRRPHEDGVMCLQVKESRSQGIPGIDSNHQKRGERYGLDSPSEPLEGTSPAHTLILDFKPPEREEDTLGLSHLVFGNL